MSFMAAAALLARACGPIRGGECAAVPHPGLAAQAGVPAAGSPPPQAGGAPSASSSDLCPSWVAPRACAARPALTPPTPALTPRPPAQFTGLHTHHPPLISPPAEIQGAPFLRSQA